MKNYLPTKKKKQKFKYNSIYSPTLSKYIEQHLFKFENGYGASVIKEGEDELYELAVITWDGGCYFLNFDNKVCNDVIRYKTIEEINNLLVLVKNLGGYVSENQRYRSYNNGF